MIFIKVIFWFIKIRSFIDAKLAISKDYFTINKKKMDY